MHDLENTLAEIAAIRSQMAGSVAFRGHDGGAVPDTGADRAGASR